MDCHFLLQGIFLTQGLKPGLLHSRQTVYHLNHQGSHLLVYRFPVISIKLTPGCCLYVLQSMTWITQMNKDQKWRLTFMGPRFMTLTTSQSRGKGQPFQQMALRQLNIHRGKKKKWTPYSTLCTKHNSWWIIDVGVKTPPLDKIWETFLGPTVREGFFNAQKVQTTRGNDLSNCTKLDLCSSEAISWGKILVVLLIKATSIESVRICKTLTN